MSIYKKNEKTSPGNYRPVSVLSIVSKVLERVAYNQLEKYLNSNNLIYNLQSGFRPGFSTDTCLIFLTDLIRKELDKGNYTGMVLIDLQKAFDTVDHTILLQKLKAIGLNPPSILWFQEYLTGRIQVVDIGGTVSDLNDITCGVPQGSILGPLLFLLYVNDADAAVRCKLLLYADDSALLISGKDVSSIEQQLSEEMASLSDWLVDNKLSLHLGKTESILFGSKRKLKKHSSLKICCNGTDISPTKSVKYLGAHINQTLSGDIMGNSVIKKSNAKLKFLYRKSNFLSDHAKKLLVSALIQCHFDYSCSFWYSNLSSKIKSKLQTTQNRMIRFVLGLDPRSHIGHDQFIKINWLPVEQRVNQIRLTHTHNFFQKRAPMYLTGDFSRVCDSHSYITRDSNLSFNVPHVKSFGLKSFQYTSIKLWNNLPNNIKRIEETSKFKYQVKHHLLQIVLKKENNDFIYM